MKGYLHAIARQDAQRIEQSALAGRINQALDAGGSFEL